MSLTPEQKGGMYDANVKLCRAVQQHSLLYDRLSEDHGRKEMYDAAWANIAVQCDDSVTSCKVRWRNLRTAFKRSINNKQKKRTPNRTREYYLHDALEFLLPYINFSEGEEARDSEDDTDVASNKNSSETAVTKETHKQTNQDIAESPKQEETPTNEPKAEKPSDKQPKRKSKLDTFYIADKQSKLGTFYIKKLNKNVNQEMPTNELETEKEEEETLAAGTSTRSGAAEDKTKKEQNRFRYRRNCKRGLDKKVINQLRVRKRAQDLKRPPRIRAMAKKVELTLKSAPKDLHESKVVLPVEKEEPREQMMNEEAIKVPSNTVMETQVAFCQTAMTVAPSQWCKFAPSTAGKPMPVLCQTSNWRELASPMTSTPMPVPIPHLQRETNKLPDVRSVSEKAVQCNLLSNTHDRDFLHSLEPYMSEMNAKQKLLFKKKAFECIMEVFDNPSNFPTGSPATAPAPEAAPQPSPMTTPTHQTLSSEESRLVHELAAVVQAAKQSPETVPEMPNTNSTATQEIVIDSSDTSASTTPEDHPTETPINLSLESDPFSDNSPRQMLHKVMQVGESGRATLSMQKGEKRRIYRILPRSSLNADQQKAVSRVGTFIIPRSALNGVTGAGAAIETNGTAGNISGAYRRISIPARSLNWSEGQIIRTNTVTTATAGAEGRRPSIATERLKSSPRQIMRRYSLSGGMPTKLLNSMANTMTTTSLSGTAMANGNGLAAALSSFDPGAAFFKIPSSLPGKAATGGNKAGSSLTAATNSATASNGAATNPPKGDTPPTNMTPVPASGVKRSLRLKSSAGEKRGKLAENERQEQQQVEKMTAGTIASDDFAGLNIKPEPLDELEMLLK